MSCEGRLEDSLNLRQLFEIEEALITFILIVRCMMYAPRLGVAALIGISFVPYVISSYYIVDIVYYRTEYSCSTSYQPFQSEPSNSKNMATQTTQTQLDSLQPYAHPPETEEPCKY